MQRVIEFILLGWLVGWLVLRHINGHSISIICFHIMKCLQHLLLNINYSVDPTHSWAHSETVSSIAIISNNSSRQTFDYTQLNDQTVPCQTIKFSIRYLQFKCQTVLFDPEVSDATPSQSGQESNGNGVFLHIPQSFWVLSFTISCFNIMSRTFVDGGGLTPLQRCSGCILQSQPTGLCCGWLWSMLVCGLDLWFSFSDTNSFTEAKNTVCPTIHQYSSWKEIHWCVCQRSVNEQTYISCIQTPICDLIFVDNEHYSTCSSINYPIYQPLRSGRIWHKVNF